MEDATLLQAAAQTEWPGVVTSDFLIVVQQLCDTDIQHVPVRIQRRLWIQSHLQCPNANNADKAYTHNSVSRTYFAEVNKTMFAGDAVCLPWPPIDLDSPSVGVDLCINQFSCQEDKDCP